MNRISELRSDGILVAETGSKALTDAPNHSKNTSRSDSAMDQGRKQPAPTSKTSTLQEVGSGSPTTLGGAHYHQMGLKEIEEYDNDDKDVVFGGGDSSQPSR